MTREEFTTQVQRLAKDPDYLEEIRAAQATVAADWGVLDGRGKERLLQLFCSVSTSAANAPA